MGKIKKAIITAGGLGTRLLPFTKSVAKEMLPIVDRPNLEYLINEAKESGIEEVIIIVSLKKPEIEKYFEKDYELQSILKSDKKYDELDVVKNIGKNIKITYVYQDEPIGLANAIYIAKSAVKGEDFAIILGDDLIYNEKEPALKQLINVYEKYNKSVIGSYEVKHEDVYKYGIMGIDKEVDKNVYKLNELVEKPNVDQAPSNMAIIGRYVLKNEIFDYIEKLKVGKNNEYQLTDALVDLLKDDEIYAKEIEGIRFDTGSKLGYTQAFIYLALQREDIGEEVKEFLKKLVETN